MVEEMGGSVRLFDLFAAVQDYTAGDDDAVVLTIALLFETGRVRFAEPQRGQSERVAPTNN